MSCKCKAGIIYKWGSAENPMRTPRSVSATEHWNSRQSRRTIKADSSFNSVLIRLWFINSRRSTDVFNLPALNCIIYFDLFQTVSFERINYERPAASLVSESATKHSNSQSFKLISNVYAYNERGLDLTLLYKSRPQAEENQWSHEHSLPPLERGPKTRKRRKKNQNR